MEFFHPKEYLKEATETFVLVSQRIQSVLPLAKIEHIGSSAISGALSKGDLDIFVGVNGKQFGDSVKKLKGLGFKVKKGTLRTSSLYMLEAFGYKMDVGIQLVKLGSEFEFFLVFRDLMNSNPSLVEEYNRLKEESVGLKPDDYRKVKLQFIEKVLKRSNKTNSV